MVARNAAVGLLLLAGCDGNKIDLGAGPERDGRLIADALTADDRACRVPAP